MVESKTIESITGKFQLKDHFDWTYRGSAAWKSALILPSLFFLFLTSILFFGGEVLSLRNIFVEAIYPSLVVLVMLAVWSLIFVIMGYRRLTDSQLTATWKFSNEGLAIEDKVGNQIIKPWIEIKKVKYSDKGVRIIYKPLGSLWLPERFLADDDLVDLKSLTKNLNLS